MSNQNQERSVRRHRRAIERWLEQRQEAMTQNAIYKDEISASVRQSMLCLARSASLGNPTRAVSSAVSRPEHMCRMLFCVLHNLMEPMFGLNIHFSIRSSGDDLEFWIEIVFLFSGVLHRDLVFTQIHLHFWITFL